MIPRVRPGYTIADWQAALFPGSGAAEALEDALARQFGVVDAIVFPYGRSAIYGVLQALELRGEIVQPAYNCAVVAHACVLADGTPVFVDSERCDPNQDADAMLDAVSRNTSAVIPTSMFGHTFDAPTLVEQIRCKNKETFVLMDLAQGFNAHWNGGLLAMQGDAAILAFGIGKAMTTLFGGAVLTNRPDVAKKTRAWRDTRFSPPSRAHSITRLLYFFASWAGTTGGGTVLADRVERSSAMSTVTVKRLRSREAIALPKANQTYMSARQAALGLVQLPRLNSYIERRREISRMYESKLNALRGVQLPQWQAGAAHTIYTLLVDTPSTRSQILNELARYRVQGGTVLDYVVPALECYRERGHENRYPNANDWAARALNLPNHPSLTNAQVEQCAQALCAAVETVQSQTHANALYVGKPIS